MKNIVLPPAGLVDSHGRPLKSTGNAGGEQTQPEKPAKDMVNVICLPPMKLKKPNRMNMVFDFKKLFGFLPEKIIIKMAEGNNAYQLCAIEPKKEKTDENSVGNDNPKRTGDTGKNPIA